MPELKVIHGDATPEEVAAILAAVTAISRRRAVEAASGAGASGDPQAVDHWRHSARLTQRRAGMQRGPWRLSGRLARRSRA